MSNRNRLADFLATLGGARPCCPLPPLSLREETFAGLTGADRLNTAFNDVTTPAGAAQAMLGLDPVVDDYLNAGSQRRGE